MAEGERASGAASGGGRGALLAAVVTVVVIAAVVIGLGFANVIPGFHLSGGAPSGSSPPATTTEFPLVFDEQGLATGTAWSVTLASGATQSSTNSTLTFHELSGTYGYTVDPVRGYRASPTSGTVVLNGAGNTASVTFTATGTTSTTYAVAFSESGLPSGSTWNVTLNGTTMSGSSSAVTFTIPNGSYAYSVGAVGEYLPTPSSGTVPVDGAATTVPIAFAPSAVAEYSVTFNETGLPVGTGWTVDLNGTVLSSHSAQVTMGEPNGSYGYTVGTVSGYQSIPTAGTVPVAGAAVYVAITFSGGASFGNGPSYPVWFNQTGLAANITWSVYVFSSGNASLGQSAEGTSQVLDLPNGTYYWSAAANFANASFPPGTEYVATPGGGGLTVNGSVRAIATAFSVVQPTATHYTVAFTETGLPAGAHWWAFAGSVNGTASAGTAIDLSLPNGTWFYNDSTDAAAYTSSGFGILDIVGAGQSVAITFYTFTTVLFNFTTVPNGDNWYSEVFQAGVAVGIAYGSGPTYDYFYLTNGTYEWSAGVIGDRLTPSSGSFTVDGTPLEQNFTLTALPTYGVTFNESGLPASTAWDVQVWPAAAPYDWSQYSDSGSTTSTTVDLPAGTYQWLIGNSLAYVPSPGSGTFVVTSSAVTVSVTFAAPIVTDLGASFVAASYSYWTGPALPAGDSWSVTFDGVTESTTGVLVYFQVPNGTYNYTVTAPSGYLALPAGGELTVDATPSGSGGPTAATVVVYLTPTPAAPHATVASSHASGPPLVRVASARRR